MTDDKTIRQYLSATVERVSALHREGERLPGGTFALIEELVEEMYAALEELRVSDDELRAQNGSLVMAQQELAAEPQALREGAHPALPALVGHGVDAPDRARADEDGAVIAQRHHARAGHAMRP